jgi:hypothetical protein
LGKKVYDHILHRLLIPHANAIQSWNVYNSANIARVKADEEKAAAREAADEQRMQELDAERRAAILRGQTPPPLPDEIDKKDLDHKKERGGRGHERKRRKLAGEDDTDMDIRLAASVIAPRGDNDADANAKVLKLRNVQIDAPLTDHAGHIDLFPVDMKEAIKREKNAEVENEKRRKERAFEDQYTMRFSNAAGKDGLDKPWYAAQQKPIKQDEEDIAALEYAGFENKNVWGNEDPRRKEREQARITSKDPFAFMQQAQNQLKKSKEDKKKWAEERKRELRELRAAQEREDRRDRHHKRRRDEDVDDLHPPDDTRIGVDRHRSAKHRSHRHQSPSRSRERSGHKPSRHHERKRSRSRSRDRGRENRNMNSSSNRTRDGKPNNKPTSRLTALREGAHGPHPESH